jgi:hypothetical protein
MTYTKKISCYDCGKEITIRSSRNKRCDKCRKIYIRDARRIYLNIPEKREMHKIRTKRYRDSHRNKINAYSYSLRRKYKEKANARTMAEKYIPLKEKCEMPGCNSTTRLQRHHWNYAKPLMINTLCQFCHDVQHPYKRRIIQNVI